MARPTALHCSDLGTDRIWIVKKRKSTSGSEITGCLQCLPGSGPRQAVISADDAYFRLAFT